MTELVERLREPVALHYNAETINAERREAATALVAQAKEIEALRGNQERMWCTRCGTVTRNNECDCTIHGTCGDPIFVNYADAMQEAARAAEASAKTAERERDRIADELDTMNNNHRVMAKQMADLGRERDEARAALKPFVKVSVSHPVTLSQMGITQADRNAARAVIEKE